MDVKTIYLGADHAGFDQKNVVKEHLNLQGYIVEDLGALTFDKNDDYPVYATKVAQAVRNHPNSVGLLFCGNAEGICMAANKFDGIRAGIGYAIEAAKTMRSDDDANILCLPGRVPITDDPLEIVDIFLTTPFSNEERHKRRLNAVSDIESRN